MTLQTAVTAGLGYSRLSSSSGQKRELQFHLQHVCQPLHMSFRPVDIMHAKRRLPSGLGCITRWLESSYALSHKGRILGEHMYNYSWSGQCQGQSMADMHAMCLQTIAYGLSRRSRSIGPRDSIRICVRRNHISMRSIWQYIRS